MRVGFPEASYTVSESAGVVELVVRPFEDENGSISNIEIPLGVRIKTRDGSAEGMTSQRFWIAFMLVYKPS